MNSERLNQLHTFLKNDPNDPFILYAIATEHKNEAPVKALEYFDKLLSDHPDYLPTYYHAAELLVEMDEVDKAKSIYEEGIELAKNQQNDLSLRELQNAYNNLLFEE